jgi:cellulose synthase/poly-beta-1,6-N-acetylglucosamine synthase-like glycosyltransferase
VKSEVVQRNHSFSEEYIVSIFSVKEKAKQEDNRSDVFLQNVEVSQNYAEFYIRIPQVSNRRCIKFKLGICFRLRFEVLTAEVVKILSSEI